MLLGLPFDTWFWFIGIRALACVAGVVCTVFGLYEGKKKDHDIEEAGGDADSWYWTF